MEPNEVAAAMIEAVIDPYQAQMLAYQDVAQAKQADEICKGILLALYRFEHECETEFRVWATDLAHSQALFILEEWGGGSDDVEEMVRFAAEVLRGWVRI